MQNTVGRAMSVSCKTDKAALVLAEGPFIGPADLELEPQNSTEPGTLRKATDELSGKSSPQDCKRTAVMFRKRLRRWVSAVQLFTSYERVRTYWR